MSTIVIYRFHCSLVGEDFVYSPRLAEHGTKGHGEPNGKTPCLGLITKKRYGFRIFKRIMLIVVALTRAPSMPQDHRNRHLQGLKRIDDNIFVVQITRLKSKMA